MRFIVIFFLFLCFLLLKENNHAYAGVRNNKICYSFAQNFEKAQQTNSGNINQGLPVISKNSLSEKEENFISDEDEDDDLVITRKYVLLVRYFITLTYSSILIYFYNYFKIRLPFCKHLSYTTSYKYILQRVLRI